MTREELQVIGGVIAATFLGGSFIFQWVNDRRAKKVGEETTAQTALIAQGLILTNGVQQGLNTLQAAVNAHHSATTAELAVVKKTAEDALSIGRDNTRRLDLVETRRSDKTLLVAVPATVVPVSAAESAEPKEAP